MYIYLFSSAPSERNVPTTFGGVTFIFFRELFAPKFKLRPNADASVQPMQFTSNGNREPVYSLCVVHGIVVKPYRQHSTRRGELRNILQSGKSTIEFKSSFVYAPFVIYSTQLIQFKTNPVHGVAEIGAEQIHAHLWICRIIRKDRMEMCCTSYQTKDEVREN